MIRFNDKFEFEKDKYNWTLHDWYMGEDKDGNPKRQCKVTYHTNLKQICDVIIDRSCGDCDSLEEIKSLLDNSVEILTKHVEGLA